MAPTNLVESASLPTVTQVAQRYSSATHKDGNCEAIIAGSWVVVLLHVRIITVIMRQNLHELPDLVQLAHRLSVKELFV